MNVVAEVCTKILQKFLNDPLIPKPKSCILWVKQIHRLYCSLTLFANCIETYSTRTAKQDPSWDCKHLSKDLRFKYFKPNTVNLKSQLKPSFYRGHEDTNLNVLTIFIRLILALLGTVSPTVWDPTPPLASEVIRATSRSWLNLCSKTRTTERFVLNIGT